jgi:hypothetical protein
MKRAVWIVLLVLVVGGVSFFAGRHTRQSADYDMRADTLDVVKTDTAPTLADEEHVGDTVVTLPVYKPKKKEAADLFRDSTKMIDHVADVSKMIVDSAVCVADTTDAATPDSIKAVIPITQKHYTGDGYDAYISGYLARLDSIRVTERTIYIREKAKAKHKWFGVGLQAGWSPMSGAYVGVGISLNLLNF